MPSGCGKALSRDRWQRVGLMCGIEDETGGPFPISGRSASNLRMPLLQRATGPTMSSSVDRG
ncbi:MAG: hypothetical protein EWM72_00742 [Nitrospira sp.]|nr:MAG: hypothetical protein EWM72_00742 [Nitrospira sp.]